MFFSNIFTNGLSESMGKEKGKKKENT